MNDEFSGPEYVDLNERRSYFVTINGDEVMIPVQQYVELPTYLAEGYIDAVHESAPSATQQTIIIELIAYLNEQFPGIADGDFTASNVTIVPAED